MKFQFNNFKYSLPQLMRTFGYKPIGYTEQNELNAVRPLGADYPRFHIYATETPSVITLSIHLDQKKVSYEGATAHSGDYESETVKEEVARIKELIFRLH
jgi:hypothetical protein